MAKNESDYLDSSVQCTGACSRAGGSLMSTQRRVLTAATGIAIGLIALNVSAGEPFFIGLGDLPGGSVGSWARAISADGSTVVGYSHSTASGLPRSSSLKLRPAYGGG